MTREEAKAILYEWQESMVEHGVPIDTSKVQALRVAIEALQGSEINCVHCPHYYETEDDTGVHSHCGSHGRLIDADALSKKLCGTTIFIKDGEVFQRMINDAPTVQDDRPHGEWVKMPNGNIECSECRHQKGWYENFCWFCGADMRKGKE